VKKKVRRALAASAIRHLGVDVKAVMVSPERATELLERNTLNRSMSQSWADELSAIMKAGKFVLSNDAVAIAADGRVLNGQHRLWAVVDSGVSVPLLVAEGIDEDAQLVMDVGRKRTLFDAVKVGSDPAAQRRVVQVAARMHQGLSSYYRKIANQDVPAIYEMHKDAAQFAVDAFSKIKKRSPGIDQLGVLAVVGRVFYTRGTKGRLLEFAETMVTGLPKDVKRDQAAILLRDFLRLNTRKAGFSWSMEVYAKTERAVAAYLKGDKLEKLYAPENEMFPLPHEKKN